MSAPSRRPAGPPNEFQGSADLSSREDTDLSVVSSVADSDVGLLDHSRRSRGGWLGSKVDEEASALARKRGDLRRFAAAVVSAAALLALVCLVYSWASKPGHSGEEHAQHRPEEEIQSEAPQPLGAGAPCSVKALEVGACPLRSLFVDPDVLAVSVSNLLAVGDGILDADDEEMVAEIAAKVFANVSGILESRAPTVALALDLIDMNAREKDAVLVHLGLLTNDKVRSFGLDVSRAIRESPSPDPERALKRIQKRLVPRTKEMEKYTAQVVPERLIALWGKGRVWSMTLDPTNIRSMEAVSGDFVNSFHPARPLSKTEKADAVEDGALEMVKSLLDFLLLCVKDIGPGFDTDIGDTLAVAGDDPLSWPCQVYHAGLGDTQSDYDKSLVCPLKFGAQGLDAMRALTQSMGPMMPCSRKVLEAEECPLSSLFVDPDVLRISAANLLTVGDGILDADDEDMVEKIVAEVFADVSSILESHAPMVAEELDRIAFNAKEKQAVLVHLGLLTDDVVRRFGLDVAGAIRESPSPDPKRLQTHIQMKLVARSEEMEKYTAQVIPERLIALWGKGRVWSMTLDPDNIRSMEDVSGGDFVNSFRPGKPLSKTEQREAVEDGALEMAKSLLDFLLLCVRDIRPDFDTDIDDTLEVAGGDPLSWPCQMYHAGDWDTHADYEKGLVCPLKFGALGLDAMRALAQA